jgi:LacI family transcriptional regulator
LNIKKLAEKAGVSVATVSYVLNGKNKVSTTTRSKILALIESEGYEFNSAARDLKKQSNKIIVICLESLHGSFFNELIDGIEQATIKLGYNFIVATSFGGIKSSAYKILSERRADGAIILAPILENELLLATATKNTPLVLLDRELEHPNIRNILLDNISGIEQAINELVTKKITKIGYIGGIKSHFDAQQRLTAFYNSMAKHRLTINESWVFTGEFDQQSGKRVALNLLSSNQSDWPQAIVCANDEMAVGLEQTFLAHRIKIPEQISIIGFDDILISQYVTPSLSTISYLKQELGYLAVDSLIRLIQKKEVTNLKIKTSFIKRNSSI